ncbi:MAG TPA: valine--tRNA ligase [Anaerolineae bacterium]|nr:valine--tRNA ligase [Anaerolineae bacterium]
MEKPEMPTTYDHSSVEQRLYAWWEEQGYFAPDIDPERKPFVISMPPPNVTGRLHVGHAITASLQDLMIRYHRMKGQPTLWLPGEDHASIAAQYVVEKEIAREGLTREGLGREKFLGRVWDWMHRYRHVIAEQHRRLGTSCDWTRERFTMDAGMARAVREAFVRLFRKGLIYRGSYLVNWCPRCCTAVSDLEVKHKEEESQLYYVQYPLESPNDKYITVATTRPETILGDAAVAVHPEDERYKDVVGGVAILPALHRRIPIIADESVDPQFGTGAVKVTPGHDPTDNEVGQRHKLPIINIMNDDATLNENAGPYVGQDRYEARKNLLADLEKEGLLVKTEPHTHALGHCERCDAVIEPRISTQWFVKIAPIADAAMAAVRDGRIRFVPERFTKVYFNWMENIRDWCISRQLWWGHRIPVWYCDDCGSMSASVRETDVMCDKCGSGNVRQDPDVLDTWFSSGLWPFSTLGWPEDTEDLRYFYPTDVLETAYDILFFWVARMIMLGLEMTGEIPFHTVYLHGLIRDQHGQKMAKSKGNVMDPLVVVEDYGADALRFALLTGSTPGNDMKLSMQKVEAGRNFANKLWNAARFVIQNLDESDSTPDIAQAVALWKRKPGALSLPARWILSRHHRLIGEVNRLIDRYQFSEAGRQIHEFLWGEFCDWYIEMAKVPLYGDDRETAHRTAFVLVYVLERTLRLLHPFMPFVTEEIWQHLPHEGEALIIAPWPEADALDEEAEEEMELITGMVRAIRNARADYEVEPSRPIAAIIVAGNKRGLVASEAAVFTRLARVDATKLRIEEELTERPEKALSLVVGDYEVLLPLKDLVDMQRERDRLSKQLAETQREIVRAGKLLSNREFVSKAPARVVSKERAKLEDCHSRRTKLEERLKSLG